VNTRNFLKSLTCFGVFGALNPFAFSSSSKIKVDNEVEHTCRFKFNTFYSVGTNKLYLNVEDRENTIIFKGDKLLYCFCYGSGANDMSEIIKSIDKKIEVFAIKGHEVVWTYKEKP